MDRDYLRSRGSSDVEKSAIERSDIKSADSFTEVDSLHHIFQCVKLLFISFS
jgi:hypothetical protein